MYKYVKKSEYAPIRKELEKIIMNAQAEMRRKHQLKFQFQLIGSGKNHLVTRISRGNGGYDFDYNLIIPHPGNGHCDRADIIKRNFMSAFRTAVKGTKYSDPKDSTSAITIKVVDRNNKRVYHSCDLAIIYYGDCCGYEGYYYLKNNKKQRVYEFAFRPLKSDIKEKVAMLRRHGGWNDIRDEYLKLKNINEGNGKRSFSLYIEAVNNVYNQMFRQ